MIVNYSAEGWEIITQRAHGLLSAQIAMQWRKKDRPERWTETVLAIADHDDAQIELEANDLLTPLGGPVNYKMKLLRPVTAGVYRIFHYQKAGISACYAQCTWYFCIKKKQKLIRRLSAF